MSINLFLLRERYKVKRNKRKDTDNPNKKHNLRLFLIGGAMGVANIIPGVSGGTIAVVFGIYEQLMEALGNFLTDRQRQRRRDHIKFLIILFSGALIAIIALARVLDWSLRNYPLPTIYFFMGLILGSIPIVIRTHHDMKFNFKRFIALLFGIVIVILLALLQNDPTGQAGSVEFTNIGLSRLFYFLICGIISASAMIVPGVSGSFMLILLGAYWTVVGALSGLTTVLLEQGLTDEMMGRLSVLLFLGIGIVIGILTFAKIMSWALKRFPAETMYAIIGLLVGSLYQIYPGFEFSMIGLISIIIFLIGVAISLKFGEES